MARTLPLTRFQTGGTVLQNASMAAGINLSVVLSVTSISASAFSLMIK
jgi:hypothetical protein